MKTEITNKAEKTASRLIKESLPQAMSYEQYRTLVTELSSEGKTSGPEQKESLIEYTQLNDRRMRRWDKTFKISEKSEQRLRTFPQKVIWLVLTESWCGDAAPSMPVMHKISEINSNISLRVLLRDEHPELMSRFLTNNAMSIPKLIMVDGASLETIGEWGPRPSKATKMAEEFKAARGVLTPEFKQDLQLWYNKDKGENIFDDLMNLLALK